MKIFLTLFNKQKVLFWASLVLILFYVGIRTINTLPVIHEMRRAYDTPQYREIARHAIWEKEFLAGDKPFITPLVFKLVNQDNFATGSVFLTVSIFSWIFLAVQVSKSLYNGPIKFAGLSFILMFSLIQNIVGWDAFLISESPTLSLFALFIAFWLSVVRDWKTGNVIGLLFITFLWVFTKDSNAYIVLMIAALVGALAIAIKEYRHYLIISSSFILFFILSLSSSNISQRWIAPFDHVLTMRIQKSNEDVQFFQDCGMPYSSEIFDMGGDISKNEEWALRDEFQAWMLDSGKSCYFGWLLANLGRSLQEPLADLEEMMGFKRKYATNFQPVLPYTLENILYPYQSALILVFLAFSGIGLALRPIVWQHNPTWFIPITLILLFLPHAVLIWHGDAIEIDRHALQAGIQFFLGFWLSLLFAVDFSAMKLIELWGNSEATEQEKMFIDD